MKSVLFTMLIVAAALTGCAVDELPQESDLDRLRVLGFQATPAEPRPGDTVTFEWLTSAPTGRVGLVWEMCLNPADCPSAELRDGARELLEAGGFEASTALTVPPALLDNLSDAEKQEGIALTLGVVAVALDDVDEEDEWGTKALPVSEADTPNNNPSLEGIEADGERYAAGETLAVYPGQGLDLTAIPATGAEETYQYVNSDGEVEERVEAHSISWYADLGEFIGGFGGLGQEDESSEGGDWLAPDSGSGQLIAVVRDGRGGTGWLTVTVVVE